MRGRRGAALVLGLGLLVAGCGGDAERDAPAGDLAPIGSIAAAATDADRREWLEQVAAEGLDRLALPGPIGGFDGLDEAGPVAAFGRPAPAIAESTRPIDRTTPTTLLGSALEALAAADVAALARLSRPGGERPTLDEDDALDAERRFLAPAVQPYWRRVAGAARLGEVTVEPGPAPDEARLRIHVGGAAGAYLIRLRKRGDGWYLAG
ncbi:MAG: hypothetical protein M9894_08765 [Planctomycetes bacterium]|nr:hypothetical protein [Planctomycetota bacterium]